MTRRQVGLDWVIYLKLYGQLFRLAGFIRDLADWCKDQATHA